MDIHHCYKELTITLLVCLLRVSKSIWAGACVQCLKAKVLHGNLIFVVATHCTACPLSPQCTKFSTCTSLGLQEVCARTPERHPPPPAAASFNSLTPFDGADWASFLQDGCLPGCHWLTAALCSASCSTTRQQCRWRKTWRTWSRCLYCEPGQPGTPGCSEPRSVSCRRKAWWGMVYPWWCAGWWSIYSSMVRIIITMTDFIETSLIVCFFSKWFLFCLPQWLESYCCFHSVML